MVVAYDAERARWNLLRGELLSLLHHTAFRRDRARHAVEGLARVGADPARIAEAARELVARRAFWRAARDAYVAHRPADDLAGGIAADIAGEEG